MNTVIKYSKSTGGYLFLEYSTETKTYRTGDSNATDKSPTGISVYVRTKKEFNDVTNFLKGIFKEV